MNVKCQEVAIPETKQVPVCQTFTCNICGRVCQKLNELKCHISKVHKRSKHEGIRLECTNLFSSQKAAKRHFAKFHGNVKIKTETIQIF